MQTYIDMTTRKHDKTAAAAADKGAPHAGGARVKGAAGAGSKVTAAEAAAAISAASSSLSSSLSTSAASAKAEAPASSKAPGEPFSVA
jgi:hypothetical protein